MTAAGIAAGVLVPMHAKAKRGDSSHDPTALLLMSTLIPVGILILGVSIGLVMLLVKHDIRRHLASFSARDYMETRDLILNLSKLIADIDASAPPADRLDQIFLLRTWSGTNRTMCRNWLQEQAFDSLTEAILLKRRFEQPPVSRPAYMIFQMAAAPLLVATMLVATLIISFAGLDEKPRIDDVYQEGAETAMVDRCTFGCCVHMTGLGCCFPKSENMWLSKVARRSESLEARGWGELELHSLA